MSDFSWPSVLGPLVAGGDLSRDEAHAAMTEIMGGTATESQIAAFIVRVASQGGNG